MAFWLHPWGCVVRGWWISWYSPDSTPLSTFELHSPWWRSGYSDDATILVAAVLADDEAAAWALIESSYDNPTTITRRFCEPLDESPFSSRWPRADWHAWDPENGITCACQEHAPATPGGEG